MISTFDLKTRKNISKDLGLNIAFDSSGRLVETIIFLIKDLRNAIAHNNVIFDTRFRNRNVNKTLLKALEQDTGIQGINFASITDYMILVIYILKKLNKKNKEILKIINDFIKIIDNLKQNIPQSIFNQIILTNDLSKLQILKSFIKNLHIILLYNINKDCGGSLWTTPKGSRFRVCFSFFLYNSNTFPILYEYI